MKRLLKVMILLAALLLVVGCSGTNQGEQKNGQDKAANEPVKFKIGHATWVGYAPLYIAKEKGFFKQNGIDPELVIIEDESQYAAAITSGQIQGLGNVIDREVIHYAMGAPINFVMAMDESAGGDGIIATKSVKTIADLKGKTVGLDKSSTSYFFFLSILEKNGLKEDDVKIQEMSAGDAGAAFVAGKLDAAVTWEPWLTNADQLDGGHVLATSKEYPGTIVDVISLRSDFVEQNPKAVKGLVRSWNQAIDWYKKNPDEGNKIMAKALSLKEDEVKDMAKGVNFYDQAGNEKFFADKSSADSIWGVANRANKFWEAKKIIPKAVDVNKLINDKFVKEGSN